jgi:hypothetical protein
VSSPRSFFSCTANSHPLNSPNAANNCAVTSSLSHSRNSRG